MVVADNFIYDLHTYIFEVFTNNTSLNAKIQDANANKAAIDEKAKKMQQQIKDLEKYIQENRDSVNKEKV